MDKLKELMGRKVLGVKMLYLALVLVVVLGIVAWKMKSAGVDAGADPTDSTDTTGTDTGAQDVPTTVTPTDSSLGIGGGGVSGGGGSATDPVYSPPPVVPTNDTWLRQGVDWLVQQGVDSDAAAAALQAYLAGDQLSYAQGILREKVVHQFGLPPEIPVAGGTGSKPTTPKPPPKVTPGTQHPPLNFKTTASINTYSEIARKFYGSSDDKYVDLLQSSNLRLGHAGPFKVGTTVFVPVKREPHYYTAKKGHTSLAAIAAANGTSEGAIKELNDKMRFPVPVGRKVRVA